MGACSGKLKNDHFDEAEYDFGSMEEHVHGTPEITTAKSKDISGSGVSTNETDENDTLLKDKMFLKHQSEAPVREDTGSTEASDAPKYAINL